MTKPKVGDRYRFTSDYGTDPGTIREGTVAEVVEVVPADSPGAGDSESTTYVLEFEAREPVLVDDQPEVITVSRRWGAVDDAFDGLLEKEK